MAPTTLFGTDTLTNVHAEQVRVREQVQARETIPLWRAIRSLAAG